MSKLPGYETTFITRAEIGEDGLQALLTKLTQAIESFGGKVVLQEDWGSRKLAYKIEKESRGRYSYLVYTGRGDVVAELERNLRLNEFVMRFLTINLAKEFEESAFLARRDEMKVAAKKRDEEREARREEREKERARQAQERGSWGGSGGGGRGPRDRGDRNDSSHAE
jgi:small subunit ribosomal protein S6